MAGPDDPTTPSETLIEHASCVALDGRGLLIRGRSGSGKSGLALQLMAHGAMLVADDRVVLTGDDGHLLASAPDPIRGLVEARGLGLLNAEVAPPARVVAVVDMDEVETHRLPQTRETVFSGISLPLLRRVDSPYFSAMLMQYLKGGRRKA